MLHETVKTVNDEGVIIDRNWRPAGVTKQFLEDAEAYHQKYYNNAYWRYLVRHIAEFSSSSRKRLFLVVSRVFSITFE